ncbi:MAG: amidohydrolase family protein [Cyclobacteriaceae bacterium]|nr:amidohydrolase family protein [Cyclobacteriaceae bacterium]MDH5251405.1 amidohydrolase family protein [Cyclobacteriaceae bacterium]
MKNACINYVLKTVVFVLLGIFPGSLPAQIERTLNPVSGTYAITHVNIVQAPGRRVDRGTVVIKNGLIVAVGNDLKIPQDAIEVKADSMFLYAGFIDGLSHAGVMKAKDSPSKERIKDPGNPPADRAGIMPQNDVRDFLNIGEKSIESFRALGFTTAHVVPYGGMLPGSSAIISTGGKSADGMVMLPQYALYSELAIADRVYPSTVIGVMAKWRELYKQASLAKSYESIYASNRSGLVRPAEDRILAAFYPVIDKRMPVLFKAEKVLDLHRVLALQSELGFPLILGEVKEGWDVITKIKSSGAKVFLSLDLPEERKLETGSEKQKEENNKTAEDIEKTALQKRRSDFIALYEGQAYSFQSAGIPFGFSTLSAKPADIVSNIRRMIKAGLTDDQALAALTVVPAKILGLSDRLGTVDDGKIANLVISDKAYFNKDAKVRYVFVEGVLYEIEHRQDDGTREVRKSE